MKRATSGECCSLVSLGGPKAQRRYRKLLLHRIDWTDFGAADDDDDEDEEEEARRRAQSEVRRAKPPTLPNCSSLLLRPPPPPSSSHTSPPLPVFEGRSSPHLRPLPRPVAAGVPGGVGGARR